MRRLLPSLALFLLSSASPVSAQTAPRESFRCHPGVNHLARGNYAAALRSLSAISTKGTTPSSLLNSRGVAELLNGQATLASATFDELLARDPQFHEARFNKGVAMLQQRRFAEASGYFAAVLESSATVGLRSKAAYHLALSAEGRGDLPLARNSLETALALNPSLEDARLYLGVLLERQQKFARAGELYRQYLETRPDSIVATLRFGVVAHRAGYAETAVRYLRQVVERAPGSLEAVEARKFLVMWE